ncbi:NAD(P)-dependent dehydrogenase, short-chain alcohol dehydrogenase family [Rhizobium sp. RU20A]|uniref:SDR family NAD(P)-dependent oxidoreductase n=1 Tax=Rhizobium sp. RU20A TaxID=1907412 RepID=UPI000953FE11|nr:SDR family NAD(P)-dependent oxidoreductase [Rhizobium sp. RU20A]SIQ30113.1 NAD(P)-dependent dehydrogenase, short-chain alcohol dehydrogenase family [Rhizobium sp. RU20A]
MRTLRDGFRAVVIGASGGIGAAVVAALESDGRAGAVIGLSRSVDGLEVTDESAVKDAAQRLKEQGPLDLVFDATGALIIDGAGPEKTVKALDPAVMMKQFALNAIGPALIIKHFSPLLPRDRRAVLATLSARVGSISDNRLGGWISYRASKAALNQIVRTAAVEIARTHPQAVLATLHPGTVDTALSSGYTVNHAKLSPAEAARHLLLALDGVSAAESGAFVAYDGERIGY